MQLAIKLEETVPGGGKIDKDDLRRCFQNLKDKKDMKRIAANIKQTKIDS